MNYMLLENQTLSSMKKQVSGYVKPENNADPVPSETTRCHKRNITCIQIICPEDLKDEEKKTGKKPITEIVLADELSKMSASELAKELALKRKYIKFVTGDIDGTIKMWNGIQLNFDMEIKVSDHAVTAMTFMTLSKRLVVATLDRMISFYEINAGSRRNKIPTSRIENMVAVPLCLEYHRRKD
jgi:WD40 repeat protein